MIDKRVEQSACIEDLSPKCIQVDYSISELPAFRFYVLLRILISVYRLFILYLTERN